MAYIFRLYKDGAENFLGWNASPAFPYNSTNRNTIDDPDGATAAHEITSIPSPFARIDLVKNAFGEVCKLGKSDGNTIFHKMVSDSLDVGEIFFNMHKLDDKVEIIPWDVTSAITELKGSDNEGHRILGDSLNKYFEADSATYNFDQVNNIYLLNYKYGPDSLNIIGATSPATLFFSNANDLSYVSNDLSFGTDKPFDSNYQPLYKRDYDYVKAWFTFRANYPKFAARFPEMDDYLNLTLRQISPKKRLELNALQPAEIHKYDKIDVNYETQAHVVEVLGEQLLKKRSNIGNIKSDFLIKSSYTLTEKLLVLPVDSGGKYADLHYITDKWGKDNAAPFIDNRNLESRTLPNEGTKMAYLTISDLLEDYIIKVPHTQNTSAFFDGNIDLRNITKLSYLLPLKPLFFKYFSPEELLKKDMDGETPKIKMLQLASGGVSVTLNIPIEGNGKINQIEYTRIYYANNDADIKTNKGGVKICDFAGMIMPIVKFKEVSLANYKIACTYSPDNSYVVKFYQKDDCITNVKSSTRYYDGLQISKRMDVYTVEQTNFDFIQISNAKYAGVLLPKFMVQQDFNKFEFAVDLGTSNTHIEFRKVGDNESCPFCYNKSNSLLSLMFIPSLNVRGDREDLDFESDMMERDLLPLEVDDKCDFHFPTKTVLARGKQVNRNAVVPFGHANIPLTQDRRADANYNDLIDDIKWGKDENDRQGMNMFVECLLLIIRNKVIVENGNLSETKLTWFYPTSMPNKRLTKLRDAWSHAFDKYFNSIQSVSMTESLAPIQFYFNRYATATNLINIDIGGGTTDVAYAVNKEVKFTTSFRFAGNNLFKNPYAEDASNGIVDFYKEKIKKVLNDNGVVSLDSLFEKYALEPSNMAAFLFSLKGNSLLKNIDPDSIDFNNRLSQDDNFRIVFIIFYTAIIYHVAQIVKLEGLDIPRHITFGGNGSKSLNVITTDADLLAKYTKLIFEKVLETETNAKLEILGLGNSSYSKESTCKGGLTGTRNSEIEVNNVVMKSSGKAFVTNDDLYKTIDLQYKKEVLNATKEFFDFLFGLNKIFDFDSNFGVDKKILKLAKSVCYSEDMSTYLTKGLELIKEDVEDDDTIDETAFFYPIKGLLQELSHDIYESVNGKLHN